MQYKVLYLINFNVIIISNVYKFVFDNNNHATMKKLIIALALAFGAFMASAADIGSIDRSGSWYYIYDQQGKKTKTVASSNGELVGFSSTMFILRKGSWYYIYNADAKKEKTLAVSTIGEIINVTGETFTSRKGSWIYTWNRDGRRINTRAAR